MAEGITIKLGTTFYSTDLRVRFVAQIIRFLYISIWNIRNEFRNAPYNAVIIHYLMQPDQGGVKKPNSIIRDCLYRTYLRIFAGINCKQETPGKISQAFLQKKPGNISTAKEPDFS